MFKSIAASLVVLLLLPFIGSVQAQDVTPTTGPAPEEIITTPYLAVPATVLLSGKDKGNQLSGEIVVDLTSIPPLAEILDVELVFDQTGTSEGILKILNKRSLSIIDSISLGKEGQKTTTRVDTTVTEWVKKPQNNFGLILQTGELGGSSEVKLDNITFNIEYYLPDKTNPVISKLDIKIINPGTVNLIWETDEPVVVSAKYGKTSNYDKETEKTVEFVNKGSLEISGLSKEITYHLKFTAFDASGNKIETANTVFTTNAGDTSVHIPVNTGILPPRLLNHELTNENGGYIVDLAWSKSETENINGYIVFRNIGDGPYSELTRLDKTVTRYSDTRVEHDVLYSYYVLAYSGTNQSGRSPVVQITIPSRSSVLGLGSILNRENTTLAIFFLLSGMTIIVSMGYFFWKKIKLNMEYNEKMTRHSRIHNVLHDPDYFINGYEDAVIEQRE